MEIETTRAVQQITYNTKDAAVDAWRTLGADTQTQLMQIYRQGFGGPPWYEVGMCQSCGRYTDNLATCRSCSGNNIAEAYTDAELQEYFPRTLADFTPGILLVARDGEEVSGFATGGMVSWQDLVRIKYGLEDTDAIMGDGIRQVQAQLGKLLTPDTRIFYENEAVVDTTLMRSGIGGALNQARLEYFVESDLEIAGGRTVNMSWLIKKQEQATKMGLPFTSFAPDGDQYQINGQRRRLFFISKP